jgi:hypothetical protein
MATPDFVHHLLGWRAGLPNTADSHSAQSRAIAAGILESLKIPGQSPGPPDPGGALEEAIRTYLAERLPLVEPGRDWMVHRRRRVIDFAQYEHLAQLQAMIESDPTGTLGVEIGRDYVIAPDVTVGIPGPGELPLLHAAVSCKWTIRSDRVQNIRHEAVILNRHRRGRQPHIVTVTAEPLATRLASIARGTGEVDAVYHLAFDELIAATSQLGTQGQQQTLTELINQHRLAPLTLLPQVLAL